MEKGISGNLHNNLDLIYLELRRFQQRKVRTPDSSTWIRKHLIFQWIHARVKAPLHLSHLASVTAATSEPRGCGLGNVQTNCRSVALKTFTVPSAQPQKMVSSDRDREWAAPVWKHDTNDTPQSGWLISSSHLGLPTIRATKCLNGTSTSP